MAQESSGEPRRAQEAPGDAGRAQESPGGPRSVQESPGEQCSMSVRRAKESHAILSICRMSLLLKYNKNALRLYAGCNSVYMPDVTFVKQKTIESALCLYSGCH